MATDANSTGYSHLEELTGSDYEIKDGQPDIKGWKVLDVQRKRVGEVTDLLFNPQTNKVRYLIADLKHNDFNLAARKIAIPIGLAELHEHDDEVLLPQVTAIHLTSLPGYEKGKPLTQDKELAIRNAFAVPEPKVLPGADFYEHEHFNQNKFYSRRTPSPQSGTVAEDHRLAENSSDERAATAEQKYNRGNIIP